MKTGAKVSTGVKAIEVSIETDDRQSLFGIVTREWLERHWTVGPDQQDMLAAFEAHRDEICDAIVRRTRATKSPIVTLA